MKKPIKIARMNISYFYFTLFDLKLYVATVGTVGRVKPTVRTVGAIKPTVHCICMQIPKKRLR